MQEPMVQQRQEKELLEIGSGEMAGEVPEGWRELAANHSRAWDRRMIERPVNMPVRDLPN